MLCVLFTPTEKILISVDPFLGVRLITNPKAPSEVPNHTQTDSQSTCAKQRNRISA
jgi:hypothetical protein